HRILAIPSAMLAQTCPARSKGRWGIAVVRINNTAMMPEYKTMAIPDEYGRICTVTPSSAPEKQAGTKHDR
ncbi:MAG: hypothetical protein ABJA75_01175, partial [Bradyrhizobium sp.]